MALQREPVIDNQVLSGDMAGAIRQQKDQRSRQIIRRQHARLAALDFVRRKKTLWLVILYPPRADRVHADASFSVVLGEIAGQMQHSGLDGRIFNRGGHWRAVVDLEARRCHAVDRSHIDDAAPPGLRRETDRHLLHDEEIPPRCSDRFSQKSK